MYNDLQKDTYRFGEVYQLSNNGFEFKVYIESLLGVLSAPFAERVVGDIGIVGVLYLTGKKTKDVSVWANRSCLVSENFIPIDRTISIKIYFSPIVARKNENDKVVYANYEIEDGKFYGCLRGKLTL